MLTFFLEGGVKCIKYFKGGAMYKSLGTSAIHTTAFLQYRPNKSFKRYREATLCVTCLPLLLYYTFNRPR
jgi:hypothetical protein